MALQSANQGQKSPMEPTGVSQQLEETDSQCERLLRNTKRQVKQMMEEAITRKFIHEDSGSILALCVTVDSCLTHRLRRRALGLFKTSSSTALIKRIAKRCPAAGQVLEQVEAELSLHQNTADSQATPQSQEALKRNLWIKRALIGKRLVEIVEFLAERAPEFYEQDALMSSQLCAQILTSLLVGPSALEFSSSKLNNGLQQQAADPSAHELMQRHQLANRVACLCHSSTEQPSTEAHANSEESAAASGRSPSPNSAPQQQQQVRQRRRPLALKKTGAAKWGGTLATDCHHYSCQEISEHEPATRGYSLIDGSSTTCNSQQLAEWPLWSPSMLHQMLHQNAKSRLLYAKNNILLEVQARATDVAGYLSLHETSQSELIMNWIPNQMINGGTPSSASASSVNAEDERGQPEEEHCYQHFKPFDNSNTQQQSVESSYLELVVSLSVSRIVLIQCQFQSPSASKMKAPEQLMLVEADGVQGAPFKFPKGGLRQFLACLDGGLRPQRRLEPAIWVEDSAGELVSSSLGGGQPLAASSPKSDTDSESALSSRLDSLLKRLPSLKRPNTQISPNNNHNICLFDTDQFADSSATNLVYRIVAASSEPTSLYNVSWSSSSSSPPPPATLQTSPPPNTQQSTSKSSTAITRSPPEPTETNRFQWSLKRLARLSYKYSNSSSGGSSMLNQSLATSATTDSTALLSPKQPTDSSLDFLDNQSLPPTTGARHVGADEGRDTSRDLAKVEAKLEQIKKSTSEDVLVALRTSSIQALCYSMRKQILARAFYGWLVYCRRARIIREHLKKLIKKNPTSHMEGEQLSAGLNLETWQRLMGDGSADKVAERVCLYVYHGGIESNELRYQVWPYLLEYYSFSEPAQQRKVRDNLARKDYENQGREWIQVERVVKQRDREILAANIARAGKATKLNLHQNADLSQLPSTAEENHVSAEDEGDDSFDEQPTGANDIDAKSQLRHQRRHRLESTGSVGSDASITDHFGNNIHRIDKDVQRCDRNFWYFKDPKNLDKLRNIMCTYVWKHLDMGYVQGMCDLAAPLLVIFDDECLAYNCFCQLMKRMVANFPHGRAMDEHFESLKHLMQIMDPKLFEILESNGDYAHFYFCYRWLLLDFKRELAYEDVYKVWETIWAARFIATDQFVVFMALAMVRYYRDIIIDNNMDFTDTIKFFNEMAERHDTKMILALARDCIVELQYLIKTS